MTKKKNIIIITLSIVLVLLAAAIIIYFSLSNWMWYLRGFEEKITIDQAHVVFGDESFLLNLSCLKPRDSWELLSTEKIFAKLTR